MYILNHFYRNVKYVCIKPIFDMADTRRNGASVIPGRRLWLRWSVRTSGTARFSVVDNFQSDFAMNGTRKTFVCVTVIILLFSSSISWLDAQNLQQNPKWSPPCRSSLRKFVFIENSLLLTRTWHFLRKRYKFVDRYSPVWWIVSIQRTDDVNTLERWDFKFVYLFQTFIAWYLLVFSKRFSNFPDESTK